MSKASSTSCCLDYPPPLCWLCTFVKNQLGSYLWFYFWVLFIDLCQSPPMLQCLDYGTCMYSKLIKVTILYNVHTRYTQYLCTGQWSLSPAVTKGLPGQCPQLLSFLVGRALGCRGKNTSPLAPNHCGSLHQSFMQVSLAALVGRTHPQPKGRYVSTGITFCCQA